MLPFFANESNLAYYHFSVAYVINLKFAKIMDTVAFNNKIQR